MEQHTHYENEGSIRSYTVGFVLSVLLTIIPYALAVNRSMEGLLLSIVILAFAVAQLIVQLVFFLHLGRRDSKWNLVVFLFMILVVLIVGIGSLWIMNNLSYQTMTSGQQDELMNLKKQQGF